MGLTRRSSAAATGSEADNLWNCFSHKNVGTQRVAVGCSDLLDALVTNTSELRNVCNLSIIAVHPAEARRDHA